MKKLGYIGTAFALPFLVFAQQINSISDAGDIVINIIDNVAVPIVFAMAFLVFIYGIFQYFIQGGHDEEKREAGRSLMLWGIIGFFVMVSVWGLVHVLLGTFRLQQQAPQYPVAPRGVYGR